MALLKSRGGHAEDRDPRQFSAERLEQIKLEDGIRLHESVKVELETYARQRLDFLRHGQAPALRMVWGLTRDGLDEQRGMISSKRRSHLA